MKQYVKIQLVVPHDGQPDSTLERAIKMPVMGKFKPQELKIKIKHSENMKFAIVDVEMV